MKLTKQLEQIYSLVINKPCLVSGYNEGGKTRLILTLTQKYESFKAYNDAVRDYGSEYNDVRKESILSHEKCLIFDDLDKVFDKRNWNRKGEQEHLVKIQKRVADCRHETDEHPPQTIFIAGRIDNIYSGITSNCSVDIVLRNYYGKIFKVFLTEKDNQKCHRFFLKNSDLLGSNR